MTAKKQTLEEGYKPAKKTPKVDVHKGFQPTQGTGGPKPKPPSSDPVIKPPPSKKE